MQSMYESHQSPSAVHWLMQVSYGQEQPSQILQASSQQVVDFSEPEQLSTVRARAVTMESSTRFMATSCV
jgi:hypothetical protein